MRLICIILGHDYHRDWTEPNPEAKCMTCGKIVSVYEGHENFPRMHPVSIIVIAALIIAFA